MKSNQHEQILWGDTVKSKILLVTYASKTALSLQAMMSNSRDPTFQRRSRAKGREDSFFSISRVRHSSDSPPARILNMAQWNEGQKLCSFPTWSSRWHVNAHKCWAVEWEFSDSHIFPPKLSSKKFPSNSNAADIENGVSPRSPPLMPSRTPFCHSIHNLQSKYPKPELWKWCR